MEDAPTLLNSSWTTFIWSPTCRLTVCNHPHAGLLWWIHFEKVLLGNGWEKVPSWECLFVHRTAKSIPVRAREWHQIGLKEAKYRSHVEEIDETRWTESSRRFLITYTWDALNANVNQKKLFLPNTEKCSNRVSLQSNWRLPGENGANAVAWSCDMEGHGKKWQTRLLDDW